MRANRGSADPNVGETATAGFPMELQCQCTVELELASRRRVILGGGIIGLRNGRVRAVRHCVTGVSAQLPVNRLIIITEFTVAAVAIAWRRAAAIFGDSAADFLPAVRHDQLELRPSSDRARERLKDGRERKHRRHDGCNCA